MHFVVLRDAGYRSSIFKMIFLLLCMFLMADFNSPNEKVIVHADMIFIVKGVAALFLKRCFRCCCALEIKNCMK